MLVTYALGSCMGICLYDPLLRLAALVHVMLPLNMETNRKSPLKYADTGIRETLRKMEEQGGSRARIVAKMAGGARMFDVPGGGSLGNIGQRNIESVSPGPPDGRASAFSGRTWAGRRPGRCSLTRSTDRPVCAAMENRS